MRIGILGGTFDPPHIGHLIIAEEAREKLELDRVYFIPARQPPHKLGQPVTPLEDRVAMLRLALRYNPFFSLSLIEADRPGPSYTSDTLRELRADFPPETGLFFIMGMDSLEQLPTWHEPREIVALCMLAVLGRPGYTADLEALEQQIPGIKSRVVFIPAPEIELSSSELEARIRAGQSVRYLVPDGVPDYITEHHLYQPSEETTALRIEDQDES